MNLNKDYNAVMRGNYGFPCGCSKCRKRLKTDEQRANKRLLWITGLITLFIVMASCSLCHAYTLNQWADAIHITEGVNSNYPYGIKSFKPSNALEARNICKRTVYHKWQNYCALPSKDRQRKRFLDYLADRYCPPSVDFVGNIRWKANMRKLLKEV